MKPDIGSESQFLPTPPAFDDPVRGGGFVGILSRRLVQKTRMLRLPDGEKNFEDMNTGFNIIHERDRRTDRRTDTA